MELLEAPEQEGTAALLETDVTELRRAWLNEKAAPELLRFKAELVQRLSAQTQKQARQALTDALRAR